MAARIFELWIAHAAPRLGAALAYYALLSLAPLSGLLVTLLSLPLGDKIAQQGTYVQLQFVVGPQAPSLLHTMIATARTTPPTRWAGLAAILLLLFGASSVFVELRSALNIIWDVREPPLGFVKGLVSERLFAFAMILGLGVTLLLFTASSLVFAVGAEFIAKKLALPPWILRVANAALSYVVISGAFALLYRFVPAVRIAWKDATVGALVTAALFVLARLPLELYLARTAVGSAYGTAASLVAFICWVYLAAQIFYLGGEFTRVYSEEFGSLASHRRALHVV